MVGMRKVVLEAYEINFLAKLFGGFLVMFLAMNLLILVEIAGERSRKKPSLGSASTWSLR